MSIKHERILIADDEVSVRLLVKRLLSERYVVLEAADGKRAIHIARTQKPDLILMDILMPNVDGYCACHAIKTDEATKAIPVVMLTALGYELNKELANQLAADAYITKPFSPADLLDTIGKLLSSGD